MLSFSRHQFAVLADVGRERFVDRLTAHLRREAAGAAKVDAAAMAAQAIAFADAHRLTLEDDIAALAELMLAVAMGTAAPLDLDWLQAIIDDTRPRKAQQVRECLAIERRLVAVEG